MSTLQQARDEIAALAPTGLTGYSNITSKLKLPAMVVGLPEQIPSLDATAGWIQVHLPVWIFVPNPYTKAGEAKLLDHAMAVRAALIGAPTGTHYKTLIVTHLDQFGTHKIIETPEAPVYLGCVVNAVTTFKL